MSDEQVAARIERLVEEEHELRNREQGGVCVTVTFRAHQAKDQLEPAGHIPKTSRKRYSGEQADSPGALEADAQRLRAIELELDDCWDLLRQRRALRDAGASPDQAEARETDTVERYLQ